MLNQGKNFSLESLTIKTGYLLDRTEDRISIEENQIEENQMKEHTIFLILFIVRDLESKFKVQ